MAKSGYISTNDYSGRYYKVSWTASQSIPNNNSTITWTLEALGGGNSWYAERTLEVTIAGTPVYSKTNRVERYAGVIATGTTTLTHDSKGEKSFSIGVRAAVYTSSVNCTGSGNFTLDTIPRQATILTAPNFNDEQNPTITYSNPAGNNVQTLQACISLTGSADDIEYRDIPKTGSSYTFNLTNEERAVLLRATTTSNSRTVKFFIKTIINGVTYLSSITKNFSVINATPTINPTVRDVDGVTTNLTEYDTMFIKYFSDLSYTLNYQTLKYATYKSCSVVCGSNTLTSTTGTFNNIESNTITFSLTDSRNNVVTKTIELDMIDYIKPTCNLETSFELETENTIKIKLNISGKGWRGNFGTTTINEFYVLYRYKINDGEYEDWIGTGAVSWNGDNTYSIEEEISGLNYLETYTIEAMVIDSLDSDTSEEAIVRAIPVFDWGENDFAFNVPVSIQGNLVGDFIIERYTEAMGSNGTWYISKWASGKAVCYGVRNYGNMGISSAWGSLYLSEAFTQSLPSGLFNSTPSYTDISINKAGGGCWVIISNVSEPTASSTGSFKVASATMLTIPQVYINFNIIGRWK